MAARKLQLKDATRLHTALCTARRRNDGHAAASALAEIVGHEAAQPISVDLIDKHIRELATQLKGEAQPKKQRKPKREKRSFVMRPVSSIDDEGTNYTWKRRFLKSSINVIFSRPGLGKSTIAADLASRISNGDQWPDGAACESGSVLYLKGEGTDASIRDRLKMAGANLSKVVISGRTDNPDDPMIDLAEDATALTKAVKSMAGLQLIIIDTLDSLYPSMRMIDNANIRKCLWPLQELSEGTGVCSLILAHTNKGGYADPLDRLSGGRAIGGAARSVWYLGKMDPKADQCLLAPVKANDFRPAKSIEYEIVGSSPDQPGAIRWGSESDITAWDMDRPQEVEKPNKTNECAEWIQSHLAGGPVLTKQLNKARLLADFGDHVWKKAKAVAEVESVAQKGVAPPAWWSCLPGQEPPPIDESLMTPRPPTTG
ncbi:MAG: helicase RepA family protein [Phycisphaeraceae bacterium]|nr:helicase RepA family protein [Phycisphaeraceae bacterium]